MLSLLKEPRILAVVLPAAAILMVSMGIRQSTGLLINPINTSSGLGILSISLALAIGQFMWGAAQPVAGALADRYGPKTVLHASLLLLAAGCALTPLLHTSAFGLTIAMGLLMAIGSGGASFSVLMGAAAQQVPPQIRGPASGIINAGGSFGQFVFAPLLQKLIHSVGWVNGLFALACIALSTLPLVSRLIRQGPSAPATIPCTTDANASASASQPSPSSGTDIATAKGQTAEGQSAELSLKDAIVQAFCDRSYWLLHAGFFTCGFHIAFLVTHLPGEVDLCGLPATVASLSLAIIGLSNIVGSLLAGASLTRWRGKHVLAGMYASRAALIAIYLLLPKSEWTFYVFAAGLGLTWLATVPPTASIVGKLFGTRYLGTLFGLTILSHQIGGFLGAWLGGLVLVQWGDYWLMWVADIALAAAAALANLPIREAAVSRAGSDTQPLSTANER